MKAFLLTAILVFSTESFAKLNVKPGLWKIEAEIEAEGLKINPHAALKNLMGQLDDEQKKELMKASGGKLPDMNADHSQFCLTQQMIDKGALQPESQMDCHYTHTMNTATQMAGSFKCKNGSSGTVSWKARSPTAYDGVVDFTHTDGKKAKMTYQGKFLSDKCKS